jgi:hypothetical protein
MTTEPAATTSLAWSRCDVIGERGWNHDRVWSRALGSTIEMPATTAGVSASTQADPKTANRAIECLVEHADLAAAGVPLQAPPLSL